MEYAPEPPESREPREHTSYEVYWFQLLDWMARFDDGGGVDPSCFESVHEFMQVGELTEAIRAFAGSVYDTGRSDEEIDRFAAELEAICKRLQTVAPFVFYGEAVETFHRHTRQDR